MVKDRPCPRSGNYAYFDNLNNRLPNYTSYIAMRKQNTADGLPKGGYRRRITDVNNTSDNGENNRDMENEDMGGADVTNVEAGEVYAQTNERSRVVQNAYRITRSSSKQSTTTYSMPINDDLVKIGTKTSKSLIKIAKSTKTQSTIPRTKKQVQEVKKLEMWSDNALSVYKQTQQIKESYRAPSTMNMLGSEFKKREYQLKKKAKKKNKNTASSSLATDNATSYVVPIPTHVVPTLTHTVSTPTHTIPTPTHAVPTPTRAVPTSTHAVPTPTHAVPTFTHTIPTSTHAIPISTAPSDQEFTARTTLTREQEYMQYHGLCEIYGDTKLESLEMLSETLRLRKSEVEQIPNFEHYVDLYRANNKWHYLESDCSTIYSEAEMQLLESVKWKRAMTNKERNERMRDKVNPHPSSNAFHTRRWNYTCSQLQKMPYECYPSICLEELSSRTQPSFKKQTSPVAKLHQNRSWENNMENYLREIQRKGSFYGVDHKGRTLYAVVDNSFEYQELFKVMTALMEISVVYPQFANPRDDRHKGHGATKVWHTIDWAARGHPEDFCMSRQATGNGSGTKLETIINLTAALERIRCTISATLEAIDVDTYVVYREVVKQATGAYKRILQACEEDVFLGEVFNTGCIGLHRDWLDVKAKLCAMTCHGWFAGGHMCFPDLGIKIPYQPGRLILACTQALEHFLALYVGVRFGMVHCSHEDRLKRVMQKMKEEAQ